MCGASINSVRLVAVYTTRIVREDLILKGSVEGARNEIYGNTRNVPLCFVENPFKLIVVIFRADNG